MRFFPEQGKCVRRTDYRELLETYFDPLIRPKKLYLEKIKIPKYELLLRIGMDAYCIYNYHIESITAKCEEE